MTVQALGQKAVNGQEAGSHATSEQDGASNDNSPVRIKSAGDDGDVTQANLSGAFSAAGNDNSTTQNATQDGGSGHPVLGPLTRDGGCGSCGGDGATVQGIGQWASSHQKADSSADSTQKGACNTNSPVRIKSYGDDGDVKQVNGVGGEVRGRQRQPDHPVGRSGRRVGWRERPGAGPEGLERPGRSFGRHV